MVLHTDVGSETNNFVFHDSFLLEITDFLKTGLSEKTKLVSIFEGHGMLALNVNKENSGVGVLSLDAALDQIRCALDPFTGQKCNT